MLRHSACPQMTSDPTNANVDQDEIDVEFINAHPGPGPGCVWTNTWLDGKVRGPSHCGTVATVNQFRTYTLDWQKDTVLW